MPIHLLLAYLLFAPANLPKGEEILAHYIAATGGRDAYEKVHGTFSKGSMSIPSQNIKGTLVIYDMEPGKQVTVIDIPAVGKMEEGTDGVNAWANSAMEGPRLKSGEEKAIALRAAQINTKFLSAGKLYKNLEVVGTEDIDGKTCYKMVLTPLEGKPETEFYEKESGLLVKESATVTMPMGEIAVSTMVGDYRKEGPILMPHSIRQTLAGQNISLTIESVQINPEFPPHIFEPPPAVKPLIK